MRAPSVLHYVSTMTRVGRVIVVMSRSGVVDVVLDGCGSTPSESLARLRSRFPSTLLIPGDGASGTWAAAVVARLEGRRGQVDAPLDLDWSASSEQSGEADGERKRVSCSYAS